LTAKTALMTQSGPQDYKDGHVVLPEATRHACFGIEFCASSHPSSDLHCLFARALSSGEICLASMIFAKELPNEGNEAIADLLGVFRVALQIFAKDSFLIEKSPQKDGHKEYSKAN
jgi:hypothetical protein